MRYCSWKWASPHSDYFLFLKHFNEGRQWCTFRWAAPQTYLAFWIITHTKDWATSSENQCVTIATRNLTDWLGDALNKTRSLFLSERAYAKLPLVVFACHKHSPYLVKKSAKERASWYLNDRRLMVLVEIDWGGSVMHTDFLMLSCATLSTVIITPSKCVALLSTDNCVFVTAADLASFKGQKCLYKDWTHLVI